MRKIEQETGVKLITANALDGYRIAEEYGIVFGCAVYGSHAFRDFFASIRDFFGGRVRGYEKVVKGSIETALEHMAQEAKEAGANAVIAIGIDSSSVGKSMMMTSCHGTAVKLVQKKQDF